MRVKKATTKNYFPRKLFELVESYTTASTTTTTSGAEIVSWLPSIDNRLNHRPRNNNRSVGATATAAAATAALLEKATLSEQLEFETQVLLSKSCLVIWDKDRFMASTLRKDSSLSSMSSFRSFERQLNLWGFERQFRHEKQLVNRNNECSNSNSNGTTNTNDTRNTTILSRGTLRIFLHPLFQEGRPDLLPWIKRRSYEAGNKTLVETIQKIQNKTNQSNDDTTTTTTTTNNYTKFVPMVVAPKPGTDATTLDLAASSNGATPFAIAIERTGSRNATDHRNHLDLNVHIAKHNTSDGDSNGDSDSWETNDANDTNHTANWNDPNTTGRRLDVTLPSGACVRINQRIPAWAIPAQEAAIEYLYQKHSSILLDSTTTMNHSNSDTVTDTESELSMRSKKASKHGAAHSNSQQRGARDSAKVPSSSSTNSEYDYTSDIGVLSDISCHDSTTNSNGDRNAADCIGNTDNHTNNNGAASSSCKDSFFSQPFSSNRSIYEATIGENRLGSLLQSSHKNSGANRGNSFVLHTNSSSSNTITNNNNHGGDSDGTGDRFCDASEDGDDDGDKFLVI